jgi:hypothetical protein
VLSYQIEQTRRTDLLHLALEEFEPAPIPVSLVLTSQGQLPQKLRAFLDFAGPHLRERIGMAA